MDKKLYIQPQTEIANVLFTQMLAESGLTGGGDGSGVGYGGVDVGGDKDPDVKGEAWTDIWE